MRQPGRSGTGDLREREVDLRSKEVDLKIEVNHVANPRARYGCTSSFASVKGRSHERLA